jgi:hypothetical protein
MNCQHRIRTIIRLESLIEMRIMQHTVYFVSFTVFFFFLDIFFVGLFSQQCLYFLFIFSLISIPNTPSLYLALPLFALLATEAFIQTGVVGLQFCLYLFFYFLARFAFQHFSSRILVYYITLIFFLLVSSIQAYSSGLSLSLPTLCTSLKFTGNLVILYFSLKWLSAATRGNRF